MTLDIDTVPTVVLAQAFTRAGEQLYGVDYRWEVDGVEEFSSGDLYYYVYQGDERATLTARVGEQRAEIEIAGTQGDVSSTNQIGCGVGGATRSATWARSIVWMLVLVSRWRRRQRR